MKRRLNLAPWLFLAPFLGLFATFTVWPLIQSLALAMQQTYGPGTTQWVGLHNFKYLLTDPLFWKATGNTARFTLGSLFIQLPVALGLALLLNHPKLKGRAYFRLIFFAPSLVGLPFVAMLFAPIFEKRTGLLNVILHNLISGWDPEFAWTQNYIMSALIIAALWMYAGFNMVYFLAALQNVSRDMLEAAEIDGAGPWQRFRHVILPEITPIAGFITLLSVIGSFQLFELSYIMLNNTAGPDNRGLTIVMYLYQTGFQTGDLGYASAIGWVLALMLITIALIQRRLLKRHEER
ncbi:MAG: sugar ABC transporter permease [Cephaloticoccus sp.]|nr:sugar ABC transporter permease [Cephaloticoccus sp.]MCF7761666.1 sugar ABC transporter permease [Cephaloticoccus sp.]